MSQKASSPDKRLTATQDWKERMRDAKERKPEGVGKQMIINRVVELSPSLDTLTMATRWDNAWRMHTADPEFTLLVEKVVDELIKQKEETSKRLARQKLSKPK